MAQSINLIPQQEQQEQQKEKIVKVSSLVSVLLLIVVAFVAAYFWYTTTQLKAQISETEENIESYRRDIQGLAEMEITARTLDAKYKIIDGIFSTRRKYSALLEELLARVPDSIELESFSLAGETREDINLAGKGSDYISIARFINTVNDTEFSSASEGMEELFREVSLNSVDLNSSKRDVDYFIVITFDESKLR